MSNIASCSHIGLFRLDLALRTKTQAYIYISVRKPLYWHIYIYMGYISPIQALHTYIYGCYIYMSSAFIWMLICIMSFAYTILACCKLVVLHQVRFFGVPGEVILERNPSFTGFFVRSSGLCLGPSF